MSVDEPWYSVRAVFHAPQFGTYEERITIWRAESEEEALDRGETEARAYSELHGYTFTGFIEAYHLSVAEPTDATEVF